LTWYLKVKAGASKKKLTAAFNALNKKIVETKDEDKIITKARQRVLQAHSRLSAAKSEEKRKRKEKKAMAAKKTQTKTDTSTQTKVVIVKTTNTKTESSMSIVVLYDQLLQNIETCC